MTDAALPTWPFWAPSDLDAVDQALTLARLEAGESMVDLGCGDGQVLVAAAARGAHVTGVESDPELCELARDALAAAGLEGEVIHADLFDVDMDADVVFTYLAPATLQRLLPSLSARRTTRLVTVDFDMPGLEPDERLGSARLYQMPGRRSPRIGTAGWCTDGALVVVPPGHQSLTVLDLRHPGGDVVAKLDGDISGAGSVLTGADHADAFDHVAVDIRWDDADGGIFTGAVDVSGLDPLPVFVVYDRDERHEGCWELCADAVGRVRRHLDDRGDDDAASLVRVAGG